MSTKTAQEKYDEWLNHPLYENDDWHWDKENDKKTKHISIYRGRFSDGQYIKISLLGYVEIGYYEESLLSPDMLLYRRLAKKYDSMQTALGKMIFCGKIEALKNYENSEW